MRSLSKWLYPGMHIKRWLALALLGITCTSLGIAYLMTHAYRTQPFPEWVFYFTLQFIDRPLRGALFIGAGLVLVGVALVQLHRSLLAPFLGARNGPIVDILYQHRHRRQGLKVVAIGGGTGLATLLRGLKEHTWNLTAVVTVADDGGSSGRLRQELGVLPPGDFRQCMVAMADVEPVMTRLFQFRFQEGSGLEGHSFGNLFIVAMSAITGSFEDALRESSRVLAVRGQILPSTLANLTLCAEYDDAALARGESAIPVPDKQIKRVFLDPPHPEAYPDAVQAILEADLVVVGPGSLFTSVLPNLLVAGIDRALRRSAAVKVYVCNVATQGGETEHFTVTDHLRALEAHVGPGLFHCVLANNRVSIAALRNHEELPAIDRHALTEYGCRVVLADVIDEQNPRHHDSEKLAAALVDLYHHRGDAGPLPHHGEPVVAGSRAAS